MERLKKKGEFEWHRRLLSAEAFFKQPHVQEAIKTRCVESAEFLQKNRGSYNEEALLKPNTPWWPTVNRTDDARVLETRGMNLRWRVWMHGIYDIYRGLEQDLEFTLDPVISLLNGDTFAVAMNLDARRCANGPTMSLADFGRMYGYSEKCGNDKARDNKLIPLIESGLFSARFKGQWSITIGPVGSEYFENVYYPSVAKAIINPEK